MPKKVRFQVLTAKSIMTTAFWDMTPYSVAEVSPCTDIRCSIPEGCQFQLVLSSRHCNNIWRILYTNTAKAVPLHATKGLGGRGDIAPTHSRPRY
jgi:hypothetical protein